MCDFGGTATRHVRVQQEPAAQNASVKRVFFRPIKIFNFMWSCVILQNPNVATKGFIFYGHGLTGCIRRKVVVEPLGMSTR